MRIEQLRAWHLRELAEQGTPMASETLVYVDKLIELGPAFAGVAAEGVVGAMGLAEQNPGNFRCWAVTDPRLLPQYLVAVCKHMRRTMDALYAERRACRIETIVQEGNEAGRRWVALLGFENPYLMRGFNRNGSAWMYERVA